MGLINLDLGLDLGLGIDLNLNTGLIDIGLDLDGKTQEEGNELAINRLEAPFVDGLVAGLEDEKVIDIKNKLVAIQEAFEPTEDVAVCDTFHLVVAYTKKHGKDANFVAINGDTAEYCLQYGTIFEGTPEEEPTEEVGE